MQTDGLYTHGLYTHGELGAQFYFKQGDLRTYCGFNKRSYFHSLNNNFRHKLDYPLMSEVTVEKYSTLIVPIVGMLWGIKCNY